jgi:peptidoglycan/xylan/chitin deacetylase (PgdA/CDA1 family)
LKRVLKLVISAAFLVVTDAAARLRGGRRDQCVVLYYHAIDGGQRAAFARQVDEIERRCFPVAPDAAALTRRGVRTAAVTFDDGFRSVVEHALPVLSAAGVPCAVFVPSGNLGRAPQWHMEPGVPDSADTVIGEGELRRLPSELVTVGSHSVSHPHLRQLDDATTRDELVESRRALESITGQPIELFSFPYGEHSHELVERCREVGYRRVFTTEPIPFRDGDDPFVMGRVAVAPDDWTWEFRLKLLGAYRWMPVASVIKRWLLPS